ncbi:UNVERIFIED_CONTAM: hypothetical protein FKN15_051898 [Acipenser sinensis]
MTSGALRVPCRWLQKESKKQQGRAMATLDRKLPTTDALLYKPWSTFIDSAKFHCADNANLDETGKYYGKGREVVRLNREDMFIFGHSPAHDEFYLVVCNICNQVLKPQIFQSHCGKYLLKYSVMWRVHHYHHLVFCLNIYSTSAI